MSTTISTFPLKHPIEHEGKTYASISFRELDLAALEVIESAGIEDGTKPTIRQVRTLLAALADVPDAALGKLHFSDFVAVQEHLIPLLYQGVTAALSSPN